MAPLFKVPPKGMELSEDSAADLYRQLQEARAKSDEMRLIAGIGKGSGTINAALSGTKPDYTVEDDIIKAAAEPEARVQNDFALNQLANAGKLKLQRDIRARETLKRVMPNTASQLGSHLDTMSAEEIEKVFPLEDKRKAFDHTVEVDNGKKANTDKLTNFTTGPKFDETVLHDRNTEANAKLAAANATNRTGGQAARYEGTNLQTYGEKTKEFAPIVASFKEIERQAPGLLSNPNAVSFGEVDRIARALPAGVGSQFMDENNAVLLSTIDQLYDKLTRPDAGANITANELKMYKEIRNSDMISDPRVQVAMLSVLKNITRETLKARGAAYRANSQITPDAWKRFRDEGGIDHTSLDFGSQAAPKAAPRSVSAPPLDTSVPVREPGGAPAPAGKPLPPGYARVYYKADKSRRTFTIPRNRLDETTVLVEE